MSHRARRLGRSLLTLLLTLALLALVAATAQPAWRKAPYLIFNGHADQMDVHWQLQETVQCTLSWGVSGGPLTHSAVTSQHTYGHQHMHTILGLTLGARYDYEVLAAGETSGGSFRTPPPPGGTHLKFLAYGDTRTYPNDYDAVSAAVLDLLAVDPAYQTFAIHVGDLVENGGDETSWDGEFFDPMCPNIRAFHATVPTQALRGNHEGDGIMFFKYLPYPYVSDFYWSFDYGPAHVAIVDQYVDYGPGSPQLAWLEADLATTSKPWKFVALHEPGWSAGVHENIELVQTAIHPLCTEYGVAALFAGHNHFYARAMVNGVAHLTTGGGGAPLYAPEEGWPHVVVADSVHHFCAIHLDGEVLRFEAIGADGELVDEFTMERPETSVHDDGPRPGQILSLSPPSPNPMTGSSRLSFALAEPAAVEFTVHDVTGRHIAVLAHGRYPAGAHMLTWRGCDDAGHAVASGIYFVRARAGDCDRHARIVLVR